MTNRIIGSYTEGRPGPLILAIGAIHGNETAGVEAIKLMVKMLEVEPITNPEFEFYGTFVGIIGNIQAYDQKQRYLKHDMNRQWDASNVERIRTADPDSLECEDLEIRAVCDLLDDLVQEYTPRRVVVIDLHTTSSAGGIFAIPNDKDAESYVLAKGLKAPVILNILQGIKGTTLHYFNREHFDYNITSVVFESGQHDEPLSVNRAVAALTNCIALTGCVDFRHIENQHQRILAEYSKDYPSVSRIVDHYHIEENSKFQMLKGFENFQPISQGQQLATYDGQALVASQDGRIIMPLYQEKGEDGFFIVVDVE